MRCLLPPADYVTDDPGISLRLWYAKRTATGAIRKCGQVVFVRLNNRTNLSVGGTITDIIYLCVEYPKQIYNTNIIFNQYLPISEFKVKDLVL